MAPYAKSRAKELKILWMKLQPLSELPFYVPIRQEQSDNSQKVMDEFATNSRDTNLL
jgi:hypothetical protein